MKKGVLLASLTGLIILSGCSSLEDEIVGTWHKVQTDEFSCDAGVTGFKDPVSFEEDGTVLGVEEFDEYTIKETDNDNYDYAILNSPYKDNTRFRIDVTDDGILKIVEENEDINDFDSVKACRMEKDD